MSADNRRKAAAIQESLAESRARLLDAIRGVTEEQFKKRPVEGGRCIAEVLALQLVSERLRAERIRLALEQDGAAVTLSDPEAQEQTARAGRIAPVPQLIHGLLAARRELERLLDEASALDGGLDRSIVHPRDGRQTVEYLFSKQVAAQEADFVRQIAELKELVTVSS
jgi:hypothetical protein